MYNDADCDDNTGRVLVAFRLWKMWFFLEFFVKIEIIGQKSNFSIKNWNFWQKLKFGQKLNKTVKNHNFVENQNFGQKSKYYTKI